MKKMNLPITVYGKGLQRKPIICLRDVVKSIQNSIGTVEPGHKIVNQTTECLSIVDMAEAFNCKIKHVLNPRVEKEDYDMTIENKNLFHYIDTYTPFENEIEHILADIDLSKLPKKWEDAFNGTRRTADV